MLSFCTKNFRNYSEHASNVLTIGNLFLKRILGRFLQLQMLFLLRSKFCFTGNSVFLNVEKGLE